MGKLSAVILIIATLAVASYSLNCYRCTSSQCASIAETAKIKCDSNPNLKYVCFKRIEKDKATSALNVTRGCHILRNDDDKTYCNVADTTKTETEFCESCNEDLCNSAFNLNADLGVVTGLISSLLAARFLV